MEIFPLMFAEVADKEPARNLFLFFGGLCVLAALPMRKSRWLAVIAIPVASLWAAVVWLFIQSEIRDPFVGPAILRELGYSYVVTAYASAIIPFIVILALFIPWKNWPIKSPQPTTASSAGSRG